MQKKERLIKNIIVMSAFFISLILISSSSISVVPYKISKSKNINFQVNEEEKIITNPSIGLALKSSQQNQVFKKEQNENLDLVP
jgi:hypothetical protein